MYGDYRANGLGHTWVDWGDVVGVLVPGRKVTKIKRQRVMEAKEQETVDDGEFQLGEDWARSQLTCCLAP